MKNIRRFMMICPLCQGVFPPTRLGQIFCISAHGSAYRNQTNQLKNPELKKRRRQRIISLKALVKLWMTGIQEPTAEQLKDMKFDFNVLRRCLLIPGERNPKEKVYKLFGFLIQISEDGYWILPPRHSENPLQFSDEEDERE